jgi:phosphoglycerol transferase MdoB-like AlkP superfamily enzyme
MKSRILLLLKTYFYFVIIFIVMKPIFMIYNHSIYHSASFIDYLQVVWHGLPLDFSVAGYFTVIPALILIVSVWTRPSITTRIQKVYFLFIAILISVVYLVDMVLYSFWGFRLDSTPVYYFLTSPKDALASVNLWFVILGFLLMGGLSFLLYFLFSRSSSFGLCPKIKRPLNAIPVSIVLLLLTAFLFVPIRGGFGTSVMNVGKVYYSINQQYNHAAINPCFSFFNSFVHEMNTKGQYRYFDEKEAARLFSQLIDKTDGGTDENQMLTTRRPNIILVILESFSAKIMQTMGGQPNVAINMDKFTHEGIFFNRFYANSFRTDRGVASILAGYPAQPTTSIMKYPNKSEHLPMFPRDLRRAGYDLQYYYGGDADFTNMRSFLVMAGFDRIVCDKDFPLSKRLSKWGAHDNVVFDRLLSDLQHVSKTPFFKIIQTSSSHEPFEVPDFHRLQDKRLNAFAYADSCLGSFVNRFRTSPLWNNTLIILVPDHLGAYPVDIDNYSFQRYHIPFIMIGGAIKHPAVINTIGSQIDIAATLLSQLGLSHKDFKFSKDLFNHQSPHFAFSTFPNAFSFITDDDSLFFNCETNKVLLDCGPHKGRNLNFGKAYIQKLYEDLSQR